MPAVHTQHRDIILNASELLPGVAADNVRGTLQLLLSAEGFWAGGQNPAVQNWIAMLWGGFYLLLMFVSDLNQKYYSNRE